MVVTNYRMKSLSLVLFALCLTGMANAQKVMVTSGEVKMKGTSATGYRTELQGKKADVQVAWNRFLKDIGKLKTGMEYHTISQPAVGSTSYDKGVLYATCEGKEDQTTVWLGLIESEWQVNDITLVTKELEKLVYQFGVKFYRDKIQLQIDEAQQALDAVSRQQGRLVNQSKDLSIKLSNNEQEKIQLEKALENNKTEHVDLLGRIEKNKKAQDSVASSGVEIRKVLEMHKERQRKVN